MLSALASVLFLGIVPAQPPVPAARMLPGIEVMSISAPSKLVNRIQAPNLSASGALLLDAESGEEMFAINADERRPMASLTKIMTALLILENHDMFEVATVPPVADEIKGSTVGLKAGQRMSVGNLMKALLLPSANDAAYTLATFHSRSVGSFVQLMNQRAEQMGLKNTHFANPAGLDNAEQYSSPRDLGWLTIAALKHPTFRSVVGTRTARISSMEGVTFDLRNTNEMLHFNEDVYGVKTGTTDNAGECLIVLFTEHDHPYLLILLGSKDRYTDGLHVLQAVHEAMQ